MQEFGALACDRRKAHGSVSHFRCTARAFDTDGKK
jgi:hypothetical protein